MEERQHALLSPSAAYRWIQCTASPLLEDQEPDKTSEFAEEGTLAHAMCAKSLKQWLGMPTDKEEAEIAGLWDRYHTGEMDEHVDTYVSIVKGKIAEQKRTLQTSRLLIETRLDFSEFVPEAFGTSDAIIIGDGTLEVVDFKYGKGVMVSADDNPQMMIYALGALDLYEDIYDIRTVKMTIIQPRMGNISECVTDTEDLHEWCDRVLKPKAAEAMAGGKAKAGDWCRFCKVKGKCRALMNAAVATVTNEPNIMTPIEVALSLSRIPLLRQWMEAVEAYALEQALKGEKYYGYKLVEGRSIRKIVDTAKAMEALRSAGYTEDLYIKPTEMLGLTALEKNVGKKRLAELIGDCIEKPKGKPTLVEMSDKRPELDTNIFDDINI